MEKSRIFKNVTYVVLGTASAIGLHFVFYFLIEQQVAANLVRYFDACLVAPAAHIHGLFFVNSVTNAAAGETACLGVYFFVVFSLLTFIRLKSIKKIFLIFLIMVHAMTGIALQRGVDDSLKAYETGLADVLSR